MMSVKLSFSLQPKKSTAPKPSEPKPKPANIFGGDDDDEDMGLQAGTEEQKCRQKINLELAATQRRAEQLAKKAEQASLDDPDIYDYDSFFDKKEQQREQSVLTKREKNKEAKYMTHMVQSSMDRKIENDIWRAARMKKEAEQIKAELQGNVPEEKFVTKAWKEKLDEIWQYKQKQAEVDAEDEKAMAKRTNFGKSLIDFRQKLLALSEEEQAQVKQEKEEMQDEYYNALNLGIKKAVKKEHLEEIKVEKEIQKQEEAIQKELLQASNPTSLIASNQLDDGQANEGNEAQHEVQELVKKFGPSEALLRRQERKQEPIEVRLERKRKRWASSLTEDDINAARERFFERMKACNLPLDRTH